LPGCWLAASARAQDSAQNPKAPGKQSVEQKVQRGSAAFYSNTLEGHKTACGGTYSPSELTAAHPTFRCGTKLRVTNLRNGKTVRVTVNDHGPTSHERIIDLSYAAAQALDFVKQGTTLVKVEVLR
jgi:rare lipoprotein A